MLEIEELPQESIRLLGIYKFVKENKPVTISIEDMAELPKLAEEITELETQAEPTFQEIETLKNEIHERREKITELYQSIDPKLRYLKGIEATQPTPQVTHESNGITKDAILKVLESGSKGNVDIAKELGLEGKAAQNKIYSICKTLESDGKVKSVNRKWELV